MGRSPVLVVWPPGQSGASLGGELKRDGLLVYSAPSLETGRGFFADDGPAVLVVESGTALLEFDLLRQMLADDPLIQILVVGREASELLQLGDSVHWIPLPAEAVHLQSNISWALEHRALRFRVEGITAELRSTEQQRAELGRRFSDLVDSVQDMVFEFDPRGRVLAVNAACLDVIGYTKTEATSLRVEDILGRACTELVLAVARGEREEAKRLVVAHRRNGEPIVADLSVVPVVLDGRAIGGRALLRDATGRQRSEDHARRLSNFYWSLSSTLDLKTLLARVGEALSNVTDVPHHALFLLQREPEQLALSSCDHEAVLPPLPAGPGVVNPLAASLELGRRGANGGRARPCPMMKTLAAGSMLVTVPCGTPGPGSREGPGPCADCPIAAITEHDALVIPLRNGSTRLGVLVLFGPDPEQWRSASHLPQLELVGQYLSSAVNNARLHAETLRHAKRLERTVNELRTTRSKLERSEQLATLSEIAMGLSHELRNPLNAITLMLSNLGHELQEVEARAGRKAPAQQVDGILREVLGLKEVLDKVLQMGRPAQEVSRRLDLNQAVTSALEPLDLQLKAAKIELVTSLAPRLPPLTGCNGELRRALINLVLNAVDAMPRGGRLTVGTGADGGYVSCSVRDTGTGVPPDHQERIFDPFFTTKDLGTGLGLPMVQRVVRGMGGRISVTSEPDAGTEFLLSFPAASTEGARP